MALGTVIDVGIGLILTYLVASLIASAIKEAAAGVFQWRGKYLTKGIDVLLSTTTNASFTWGSACDWLAVHFGSTSRMAPVPTATAPAALVAATPEEAALQKVRAVVSHPLLKGTPSKLPSYVPSRDFATALLDLLRDGSASPVFTQVETTVAALPECDIKRILTAFIQDAAWDLDKLRTRIESWFDDSMDRLSGIYKRFVQYILFGLGLAIAVAFNVDSVHLASALWYQPELRTQMVAAAQTELAKSNATTPASVQDALAGLYALPVPIGRGADTTFFGQPTSQLADASVPMGRWLWWDVWTVVGWFISAIAISLGAPFWFDLLQNFMSLRSAGPQPARADAQTQTQSG
jgi:hypothetical protein